MPVVVAMACEMVVSGNRSLLARVSIVNRQGSILLDEYVKPTAPITNYKTFVSGIKRKYLDNGQSFNLVRDKVSYLLRSTILVGHSLHFDLDALGLSYPESNQRDLAKYGPFMKNGQPQKLQFLSQKYLKRYTQEEQRDSLEDARTAMLLYYFIS